MRSLSVPDRLGQLADEIRELEETLETTSPSKSAEVKPLERHSRAVSFHNLEELQEHEEEDYFFPALSHDDFSSTEDDDNENPAAFPVYDDDGFTETSPPATSHLAEVHQPSAPMTLTNWETQQVFLAPIIQPVVSPLGSSNGAAVGLAESVTSSLSSTRTSAKAMTVVEEEAEMDTSMSQRRAEEVVAALSDLLGIQHVTAASPASSPMINAEEEEVHSQQSEQAAQQEEDFQFRMLRPSDRSHSLPPKMPPSPKLKPSLKSSSSLTSSNSLNTSTTVATSADGGSSGMKLSVSFGTLKTREYSIALSDHPSCSFGPPIALGWDYQDKEAVDVEDYENQRRPRRSMEQMVLSYNVRRFLLLKRAGYSKAELKKAMVEADRVKRERYITDLLLPIDETLDEVVHHIKNLFSGERHEEQRPTNTLLYAF